MSTSATSRFPSGKMQRKMYDIYTCVYICAPESINFWRKWRHDERTVDVRMTHVVHDPMCNRMYDPTRYDVRCKSMRTNTAIKDTFYLFCTLHLCSCMHACSCIHFLSCVRNIRRNVSILWATARQAHSSLDFRSLHIYCLRFSYPSDVFCSFRSCWRSGA